MGASELNYSGSIFKIQMGNILTLLAASGLVDHLQPRVASMGYIQPRRTAIAIGMCS